MSASGEIPRNPNPDAAPAADLVGPVVPRAARRRDWVLPILLAVSLTVHATIMLPSLLGHGDPPPPPPQEIPIDIVQLPPKPADTPKPPEKKVADAPKPPEKKREAKADPPKPAPKPAPKPQRMAQKPPPKPAPQKTAAKPPPKPETPKPTDVAARLRDLLGAMPAIALPGASADGTEDVSYAQLVLSKVAKVKKDGRYPGTPGAASVSFTIGDAGEVASVSLVRPSGERFLDEEAVAMIKRGAPYPPPPAGERRNFTITLRFEPVI